MNYFKEEKNGSKEPRASKWARDKLWRSRDTGANVPSEGSPIFDEMENVHEPASVCVGGWVGV